MPKTYLEPEEVMQLEEAAGYLRDKLLVRLTFRLGCRISESLGIAVGDIDLEQGTVTIQHLKTRLNLACPQCHARLGRRHIFCPGCGGRVGKAVARELEHRRMRTLPLDSNTLHMLEEYINRDGPVAKGGKRLLFGINRHRAWQIVSDAAQRAGLDSLKNTETGKTHHVSPHRLRDAFAINAVKHDDSGDGLRLLQEHLGHQNVNTTLRYRKVAGHELKEWYDGLWKK